MQIVPMFLFILNSVIHLLIIPFPGCPRALKKEGGQASEEIGRKRERAKEMDPSGKGEKSKFHEKRDEVRKRGIHPYDMQKRRL